MVSNDLQNSYTNITCFRKNRYQIKFPLLYKFLMDFYVLKNGFLRTLSECIFFMLVVSEFYFEDGHFGFSHCIIVNISLYMFCKTVPDYLLFLLYYQFNQCKILFYYIFFHLPSSISC